MKKLTIAALALSAFALSAGGCGVPGGTSLVKSTSVQARAASVPTTKDEFVKACATLGCKLTPDQLDLISKDRAVQPNGQWAPRPAENLTAEQNLNTHFLKHGHEFHPAISSEQQYLQQAMDLASGKRGTIQYYFDTTSFAKGYQSNVVRWNSQTHEMTAVRPDGAMTTYYLNFSLAANRFVVVPQF